MDPPLSGMQRAQSGVKAQSKGNGALLIEDGGPNRQEYPISDQEFCFADHNYCDYLRMGKRCESMYGIN
jgi:hypothetical protein